MDANQNFILNTFDVTMKDVSVASGTQYIGWDAAAKKPRAWSFLFNGGFTKAFGPPRREQMEDRGRRHHARRRQSDGDERLHEIDADHFSFQFTDRTRDGKALPDDKAIKMKRVQ